VELRKIRPDVPVVITSGFGGAIADRLRRSAGFLHKPFRLAELIAEIDTAMGRPTQ
jgi:DNA-binding response OmpR family regulator